MSDANNARYRLEPQMAQPFAWIDLAYRPNMYHDDSEAYKRALIVVCRISSASERDLDLSSRDPLVKMKRAKTNGNVVRQSDNGERQPLRQSASRLEQAVYT
nr:hypothetical protein L204_05493 [Cryptococcus depauperatus CBS 7855]